MDRLPDTDHEVFRLIAQYIDEHDGKSPYRNNEWFVNRVPYSDSAISNAKARLRLAKYLDDRLALTDRGKAYIRQYFSPFAVRSATLHVQGTAKAGPANHTLVDFSDWDNPSDVTIKIPEAEPEQELVAVRVVGTSMTEMAIWPNDYVIIEKRDRWWPQQQDLIVAKYVEHDPNRTDAYEPRPDEYVGPVLKVYLRREGERGCILGWRKANEKAIDPTLVTENLELIRADYLQPIGKVIGVYRTYR